MERSASLTPLEWVSVLGQAAGITFGLAFRICRALLTGKTNGSSFHELAAYLGMRQYQSGLSVVAIQNLLPSTSKICSRFAKKHGIPFETIQLPDETVALRLGPPNASKAVAYFHGGGYMAPALGEHVPFALGYGVLSTQDVAVYVLQYHLASETANHYPCQLRQAVSLINHILSEGVSPEYITLLGDSAGAHLALGLLLHMNHPNPLVPQLKIDAPLSGSILISPWVRLQPSAAAAGADEQQDVLSAASLDYWAKNFLGEAAIDPWNNPLTAPTEWWTDLPVKRILVTYGERELLRDGTVQLCQFLRSHHQETTALECAGELHVHMVMNRFLLIKKPCESENAYKKWLGDHFNGLNADSRPAESASNDPVDKD